MGLAIGVILMSDFTYVDKYIAEFSRRGVKFDAARLRSVLGIEKYNKLLDDFGGEANGVLELHPNLSRTISGRIQTSAPNVNGFSKEARDCMTSDKTLYSVDVISEELNIIMELLGRDYGSDVYGEIARHVQPVVRAVVLEDTTGSEFAPLRHDEVLYGKEVVGRFNLLFSRLFDASFLTLDGCSFDGRGSHENFSLYAGNKKYIIQSMQRIVAGSEEALFAKDKPALLLLKDCDTDEPCLIWRNVKWEADAPTAKDAATGIGVTYYHGTIQWLEDESLCLEDDAFASMRRDVKNTLIAYCYGARPEQALDNCGVLNPIILLKLYDSLGIRAGLKQVVTEHREGNVLNIDGRRIETHYEAGTPYTKYASVLVQNIGVAILNELLGIAYRNGLEVIYTEHDEVIVASDLSEHELQKMFVPSAASKYKWGVKVRPMTW